jgi:SAM-dependent methyltransferase
VTEDGLFDKRATAFGELAFAYAEHRPDYPIDGIRWALAGAGRAPATVLDLGAGTGKLTGGLLALGLEVIAVEPDTGMLGELTRRFPAVPAVAGTAERIPLAGATVDAVLAGQAFHWFRLDPALTEIGRVLRPGGVFAALWNYDDQTVDWVAKLDQLAHTSASHLHSPGTGLFGRGDDFPVHQAFSSFERRYFRHTGRHTAESLTATLGTHSHTIVIPPRERAEVLARVRAYLESLPETGGGEFELPMRTTVLRARVSNSRS